MSMITFKRASASWPRLGVLAGSLALVAAVGCNGSIGKGDQNSGGGGSGGGNGPGGHGGTDTTPCTTTVTLAPQRVVRLTLKQIANATGAYVDSSLTQTLVSQQ